MTPDVGAPGPVTAGQAHDVTTADAGILAPQLDERKEFARLQATAARGGFVVHELSGGAYLLGRWGHSRELPSLHALAVALRQMGMPA